MREVPGYETFEHGADAGIRGAGHSPGEAFAMAAKAMFSLMVDDIYLVPARKKVRIRVEGFDRESLLLAWLNQLLAEADIRGVIFSEFQAFVSGTELEGLARGSALGDRDPGVEVKAATYSQIGVYQENGIWIAQCVVDV